VKSRLIILAVFAVCLALIGLIGVLRSLSTPSLQAEADRPPPLVRAVELKRTAHEMKRTFYGLFEAEPDATLGFEAEGRLESLGGDRERLTEGLVVAQGDELGRLDASRYQAQLDEASATVEDAEASLAEAEARIEEAEARLEDARRETERLERLLAAGSTNRREVERAQTELRVAEAALDSARARRRSARAALKRSEASQRLASRRVEDTVLRAPFAGRVARVYPDVGELLRAGEEVVRLVDVNPIRLVVGVVERRLPWLDEGQPVRIRVEALADGKIAGDGAAMFEGVVEIVPPAADQRTGLFRVEIEVANPEHRIRPGMVGQAVVTLGESRMYRIPASAVFRTDQGDFAFFVEPRGVRTDGDLPSPDQTDLKADEADDAGRGEGSSRDGEAGDAPAGGYPIARRLPIDATAVDGDAFLLRELPRPNVWLVVQGQGRLRDGQAVRLERNVRSSSREVSEGRKRREKRRPAWDVPQTPPRLEAGAQTKQRSEANGTGPVRQGGSAS